MRPLIAGLLAILVGACAAHDRASADLAITGAWIHDGTGAAPLRGDVAVKDGRFAVTGPRRRAVQTIDGRGLHLVPGLIDMHVHVAAVEGKTVAGHRFAERGVTTVRDLGGFREGLRVAAVSPGGPRIRSAIATLNGEAMAPFHRRVASEEDVRGAVAELARSGAAVVKIHRAFPPSLLPALIHAARSRKLQVTGHIPLGLHPLQACELGLGGIEHVGSLVEAYVSVTPGASQQDAIDYLLSARSDDLYRCLSDRGVTATPTLVLYESIARARSGDGPILQQFRRFIGQMQAITLRLHRAGVALLPGSDASGLERPAVTPGAALLRELELLKEAGLPGEEVVRIAAANPARSLGIAADGRLIAPGLAADFILLRSDPRIDVSTYRYPAGIYFAGEAAPR